MMNKLMGLFKKKQTEQSPQMESVQRPKKKPYIGRIKPCVPMEGSYSFIGPMPDTSHYTVVVSDTISKLGMSMFEERHKRLRGQNFS